jgi:riboflavin transporter FmnP
METKTVATITIFAAVTIALNLSPVKIPAPFAPYLIYQIWEIPIVAALLLFGATVGFSIAVVNTLALFAFFPGTLPTGPLYNLAAVTSMLFGILVAKKITQGHGQTLLAILSTTLGTTLRVAVMGVVNWMFLRYPPPVGFSMPEDAILAATPLIAFFNLTLALYTIPVGHFLAEAVKRGIKVPS